MNYDLIIVGAGAAGLLAAASAASGGCRTILLEKNKQAGVKILMSGGTRCNITHATDQAGIAAAFAEFDKKQAGFLRSSLAALPPERVIELVEAEGVATKIEDTGKIFPVSNRAIDVRDALLKIATDRGAEIRYEFPVTSVSRESAEFTVSSESICIRGRRLLITTGGQSFPGCGTTGDGYLWARQFGHKIINPVPALTPVTTGEKWVHNLKGITVADAAISVVRNDPARMPGDYGTRQFLNTRRSSLLLTHFGFSGPAALDVSRTITRDADRGGLSLVCDFFPESDFDTFYGTLAGLINSSGSKQVIKALLPLTQRRLAEAAIAMSGLATETRCAEVSRRQIRKLAIQLKACLVPISGTLGFKKAEVTAGGVALAEVDSKTMQSKLVEGLYFAGEVLDIDGPIGGFNFQAAFSTGWLAGRCLSDFNKSKL